MTERLRFTKMQGVGNDFVVVDGRQFASVDWSTLALELCDRHTGVGADGLLVLENTHLADIRMRMYNPDGTPDVCGNGLRCLARYAVERGIVPSDTLRIATLAGVRTAHIRRCCGDAINAVTVDMSFPRFEPSSIPMRVPSERVVNYPLELDDRRCFTITALSTGSTHTVVFVDSLPDDALFFSASPQIERHPVFPDRTSVMWCRADSANHLTLRIWERGAGETLGCGTGACAAGVASVLRGIAMPGVPVTVASKGGELTVVWREGAPIEMTGPAETVFEAEYMQDLAMK